METVEQLKEKVAALEQQIVQLQSEIRSLQAFSDELVRAVNDCVCE